MKKLTKKQIQDYIDGGGNNCPFCGDWDIVGGDRDMDGGIMSQEIECSKCGQQWQDLYKLYNIYIEEPGKFPLRLG